MQELEGLIEPKRLLILSKMILLNNYYAEYLLTFEKFKERISYSGNHLFWSNKNELLESKNIGVYGFNKNESWENLLEDKQLKPLLISYLGIKAIMQNDRRIFEKWQLSFDNLAEELNNSVNAQEMVPKKKLKRFNELIDEIKKQGKTILDEE